MTERKGCMTDAEGVRDVTCQTQVTRMLCKYDNKRCEYIDSL